MVNEMARLGGWVMRGHIPPYPPGEAPAEDHVEGVCKLCGEHEYQRRRDALRKPATTAATPGGEK